MHAVIFEVLPEPERRREYLDLAAALRPELERIDGFLAVERFASARHEGKILSRSLWRDEAAIARWRRHAGHRAAQAKGRGGIFRDYRLRVAEVLQDEDPAGAGRDGDGGARACIAALEFDPPGEAAADAAALAAEQEAREAGSLVGWDRFDSLYTAGRSLLLTSWTCERPARAWAERIERDDPGAAVPVGRTRRLHLMAVVRDYGMFDRAAAPQAASGRTAVT